MQKNLAGPGRPPAWLICRATTFFPWVRLTVPLPRFRSTIAQRKNYAQKMVTIRSMEGHLWNRLDQFYDHTNNDILTVSGFYDR